MIVCIDSGNTRIKWGVRDADNWLAQGALAHAELAGLEVLLSQWKPSSVLLSNVAGPQALAGIQQALAPWQGLAPDRRHRRAGSCRGG